MQQDRLDSAGDLDRPDRIGRVNDVGRIAACAPTELPDPTPFIAGKEVVLTTGVELLEGPRDRHESFVERLADVDVAAIGLGTGMSRPFVLPECW